MIISKEMRDECVMKLNDVVNNVEKKHNVREEVLDERGVNFLVETKHELKSNKQQIQDIYFIGTRDGKRSCSWQKFTKLANYNYDCGFGSQEIIKNLVIAFKDGSWMERSEYDGSEWWDYKKAPKAIKHPLPLTTVDKTGK